jgi:hypothetical protein
MAVNRLIPSAVQIDARPFLFCGGILRFGLWTD